MTKAAISSIAAIVLLASVGSVRGHAHVIIPRPRNSIDAVDQPLFANGQFPQTDGEPGCTEDMQVCGCWCANGTSPCNTGQSCYWFSQGCTIGCDKCLDGEARTHTDLCKSGLNATVCDPRMRTYNMNATCNGPDDIYRWYPWRYPGSAPVTDPCGKAGGGGVLVNNTGSARVGVGAAFFLDTPHAKANDLGSKVLPPLPTGTVWRAGAQVEAMWGLRANHGGGYQVSESGSGSGSGIPGRAFRVRTLTRTPLSHRTPCTAPSLHPRLIASTAFARAVAT